jgi:hypothetical protein
MKHGQKKREFENTSWNVFKFRIIIVNTRYTEYSTTSSLSQSFASLLNLRIPTIGMAETSNSSCSRSDESHNGNTTDTTRAAATTAQYHNAAETVIAATAGRDNWQTWAGRNHGTEGFQYLDVFHGIKRTISNSLGTKVPKSGTPCPICFCDPEESSTSWHVTWCGHAVCVDCLGQYATNQVGDREQHGPLKCPVCLKTLRKQDAIVAMMAGNHNAKNEDLIKQWDAKMRDQLLRAIPSFRSCPKCGGGGGGGSSNSGSGSNTATATSSEGEGSNHDALGDDSGGGDGVHNNGVGGGFVTPECLGPQHQERREQAVQILLTRNYAYAAIVLVYLVLVGTIALTESPSAKLDLWSMLLPIYFFAKIGMALNFLLATRAREALFRSISVECPCCDETFVLPTESKQLQDEETSRWVNTNTRQCPSCSVPISKTGGCNHIRCSHCGVTFCWACMRLRTACQAYRCKNGAPYRNASFLEAVGDDPQLGRRQVALQSNGSVLTYIDYILNHRVCPELLYSDGLLVLACLVVRHFRWVQFLEREILSPFLFGLNEKTDVFVSLFFVVCLVFLALPIGWVVSLERLLIIQLFVPPERRQRIVIDHERREKMHYNVLFISFVSLFSLPIGVSMGLCYFLNEILPILRQQQQGHQEFPEREGGQPMAENPIAGELIQNILNIDQLNENMLNEVLRRSIEDN